MGESIARHRPPCVTSNDELMTTHEQRRVSHQVSRISIRTGSRHTAHAVTAVCPANGSHAVAKGMTEVDSGQRPGLTTDECERLKALQVLAEAGTQQSQPPSQVSREAQPPVRCLAGVWSVQLGATPHQVHRGTNGQDHDGTDE